MGGDLYDLWRWRDDHALPPRLWGSGRWCERGLGDLWACALLGLPAAPERLVLCAMGQAFSLPEGWEAYPGAALLRGWAAGPDAAGELGGALGQAHRALALKGREAALPGWGGAAAARALCALAERADSAKTFVNHVEGLCSRKGPPPELPAEPEPARPAPPPGPPLAETCGLWALTDPAAFAWSAPLIPRLPPHARVVTPDDRHPGAPPAGTLWWSRPEGGWALLAAPELFALEASRGRSTRSGERVPLTPGVAPLSYSPGYPGTFEWGGAAVEVAGVKVTVLARPEGGLLGPPAPWTPARLAALGLR